uniref:Uncharacterized protein n=1 Tax=Timema shepardi TaxID=629360 RepID=A0A7R9G1U9_TIMSH|nr:unnamed protein product [Timema shepardi]
MNLGGVIPRQATECARRIRAIEGGGGGAAVCVCAKPRNRSRLDCFLPLSTMTRGKQQVAALRPITTFGRRILKDKLQLRRVRKDLRKGEGGDYAHPAEIRTTNVTGFVDRMVRGASFAID